MIGNKKYILLIFAVFAALIFTKCTQPLCEEKGDVEVNIGFYKIENSVLADTLVDSVSVILDTNIDTVYFENMTSKVQNLSFPISINSDTSKVIITFDQSVSDTLTFIYKRDLRMISHECGFVYFFEIIDVQNTTNKISSVWITNKSVKYWTIDEINETWTEEEMKNGFAENIKIYL